MDETSFQKRREYVTAVTDLDRGVVLYVADDRKEESLSAFFEGLGSGNRETIEVVVCMDAYSGDRERSVRRIVNTWSGMVNTVGAV